MVLEKIDEAIEMVVVVATGEADTLNYEEILNEFFTIIPFDEASRKAIGEEIRKETDPEKLKEKLIDIAHKVYTAREEQFGEQIAPQVEKQVMLEIIDSLWIKHLDDIDDLREGVRLRGYAQRDPLVEYKNEAFKFLKNLWTVLIMRSSTVFTKYKWYSLKTTQATSIDRQQPRQVQAQVVEQFNKRSRRKPKSAATTPVHVVAV